MNVLVIGYGLLGSELVKQTGWDYISRKENKIDFIDSSTYIEFINYYDTIVNCVALTNTYGEDRQDCYNINFKAVTELSDICVKENKKLIHISTDYVYAGSDSLASEDTLPIISPNWYTYYKLLADEYIMLKNNNYLICRCSFKPNPYPYDNAWIDQIGNFDTVNNIAKIIIDLIKKDALGLFNVGTELKSIYELGKSSNSSIKKSLKPNHVPGNISMNLNKLNTYTK